ncbi:MAG: hypothetical protein LBL52_04135 [Rickettsiales bacterium]|nr:hypothetical protein [Rickettsiales bacterium]
MTVKEVLDNATNCANRFKEYCAPCKPVAEDTLACKETKCKHYPNLQKFIRLAEAIQSGIGSR